jgi:hypothetical protein
MANKKFMGREALSHFEDIPVAVFMDPFIG